MNNSKTFRGFVFYCHCLFILLFLAVQETKAQPQIQKIDSLIKIAQSLSAHNPQTAIAVAMEAYRESSKIANGNKALKSLNLVAFIYLGQRDFKQAHIIAGQGVAVAKKFRIDSLIGDFWNLNGYIFHLENNYEKAIVNYQETIPYYEGNKLLKRLGNIYLNIGICEMQLSRFETANIYLFKSADEFVRLKDTSALSNAYNSIGSCYSSLFNYKMALEYNRKALFLRLKFKDKSLVAQSYNNIGFAFKENKQADSAITYLLKCLSMRRHEKDSSILVLTLQNIGSSFQMQGNPNKGKSYILRSLKIASGYQMKEEQARGNLDLAKVYLAERNYKKVMAALDSTEATATKLKLSDLLMDSYSVRSDLYEQMGDFKKSLLYFKKKSLLRDTLLTYRSNKAISELEISYKTRQREKDMAALYLKTNLQEKIVTHQKQSILLLVIAAILLLVILIILYNNFRIKNIANHRIQLLMKELHHRVKNNLQILAGLFKMQIESLGDEKMKNALRENESRLTSMNLIHNKLYLDNTTTQIEMKEYLTKLLHHIKKSFGRSVNEIILKLEIESIMLEADKAVAIGLIVNELATNAFKYAFDDEAGEILIGLKQESKSKLLLTLRDNGKGITDVHKKEGASFGLKLVNLMVRQLNSSLTIRNESGVFYQMEIVM